MSEIFVNLSHFPHLTELNLVNLTLDRAEFGQARLVKPLPRVRELYLDNIGVNEDEDPNVVNTFFYTISTLFANLQELKLHFTPKPGGPYLIPIVRTKSTL